MYTELRKERYTVKRYEPFTDVIQPSNNLKLKHYLRCDQAFVRSFSTLVSLVRGGGAHFSCAARGKVHTCKRFLFFYLSIVFACHIITVTVSRSKPENAHAVYNNIATISAHILGRVRLFVWMDGWINAKKKKKCVCVSH